MLPSAASRPTLGKEIHVSRMDDMEEARGSGRLAMTIQKTLGVMTLTTFGLILGGCAGTASGPSIYQLEVRSDSVADAKRQAMEQAQARCQGQSPVVLDSNTLGTDPTFTDTSSIPASQSEVADYEATTHEGEKPVVRWRYRCE